jgi:hypothetical protein
MKYVGAEKRWRYKAENFSQQITKLYISSHAMAELSFFFFLEPLYSL